MWDVSSAVAEGDNTLRISFQSAVLAARARAEQEEVRLTAIFSITNICKRLKPDSTPAQLAGVAPSCVPAEYHGECHANLVRKMQGQAVIPSQTR